MKNKNYIIILLLFCSFCKNDFAQTITFYDDNEILNISNELLIFEDINANLSINDISKKKFRKIKHNLPNFGLSKSIFWIKFSIKNTTQQNHLLLNLALPSLDSARLFYTDSTNAYQSILISEFTSFNKRKYKDPNYLFDLFIPSGTEKNYFLKISSIEGIQVPIYIGSANSIINSLKNKDILSGIYFGVMLVMIIYNLFIYISVKDKSYIYYVIYIILILLTQTSLQGYPYQYLWPNLPLINKYSLILFPSLVGIAGIIFMNAFLKVKANNYMLYKISFLFSSFYIIPIIIFLLGFYHTGQQLMQINAMSVSFFMLITVAHIYKKGFQPAKYFLAAWIIFLSGVIVFILKDLEVLPYNNFTRYTMQIGSALETVLLSFALAARINDYKKEKEISQRQAFLALEEKEQLVREQNIVLELKVKERTLELNETLDNLKSTQTQLVESEKMASLGQLTAGVAHEINNPINFVSSNISPLKQDIDDLTSIIDKYGELKNTSEFENKLKEINDFKNSLDYNYLKEELNTIINGIENGAKRTTEIVDGLRNFSRLDESDLMLADINEGINSTLTILKSRLSSILLDKNLADLPKIECYPGKLNQVFMNVLTNAIEAIEENKNNISNGNIYISTSEENDFIKIIITDNGIGIKEEIKQKIFDPFFTTKDVGKGTGLGLSIVYKIIENHKGSIDISSEVNKGTMFTIFISKNIKN